MVTTSREKNLVLVVEDDAPAREACSLYLEHYGYKVMVAADAESALQQVTERKPDIMICDWHLGGGPSGVDVARQVQREHGTPLIFMTAYPAEELLDAANDLDIARVLKKPISLPALADAVRELNTPPPGAS